eukprot:IDg13495t1
MGQEQSAVAEEADGVEHSEDVDVSASNDSDIGADSMAHASGYRVMKVFRGSAAARCGLRAFEDFVVGVRGEAVSADDQALPETLARFEGRDVELAVFNIIDRSTRALTLRPVKWNGPGLLGAAVRFEPVAGAADHVWHVVDVFPSSPADAAGLVPASDYIVGTPAQAFRDSADFSKLVCSISPCAT